ncbi:MAG: 16S rRNA (uracil(1498)-N(3))-methyltransferase [Ruminococcus sp.]|jgi:16S rRNA (uracil1498-N3)-methyltransferase|nr:16S rRNA (uracil(1498)-N(3))-methyltransferase [Ruminococcus sp.]
MKFFLPFTPDKSFTVDGADAAHIMKSLRKKAGDTVIFTHGGVDFTCKIESSDHGVIEFSVISERPSYSEPNIKVTLFQAYPKQDKLDFITEKCTELGVGEIVPFLSSRVIPSPRDFSKKRERLMRIAESAARQSGRGLVPQIGAIASFPAVVESLSEYDLVLFCYENGGARLSPDLLIGKTKIALIIGAEGGFSSEEAAAVKNAGGIHITLGERILRCETAPVAALAVIMNLTGN